jgi:hypothetical protein
MDRHRFTKNAILFAVTTVVLLSSVSIVMADETTQPIQFEGTLQYQNGTGVPAGAVVCAYIIDELRGSKTTDAAGEYGIFPHNPLSVTGDSADEGKNITFKVDDVQADPEFPISDWETHNDALRTWNLVVSGDIMYSDLEVTPMSGAAPLNVTANATVTNNGASQESYTAPLKIGGVIVDWRNGTLAASASTTVSFEYQLSEGTHSVGIASLTAVTVESGDSTPPVITDVANSTPTTSSVAIIWTTDDASDSRVKYGTVSGSGNYTLNVSNTTMVTSHSITLEGLAVSTRYYFVVNSTNVGDKSSESSEYNFTTASHPVPIITSFLPTDGTISDIEGASRTFNITIDQTVNVTWLINGTTVKATENGVTAASYTNTSAAAGVWNVSAVANNTNGTDMQTWIWKVAETSETNVTGTTNFMTTLGDVNVTGNFTGNLTGWVNVTDMGDDLTASPDVNDSTLTAGLGTEDTAFGGVYIDASQSNLESELAAGNGSMRIELHYTDAELTALGITDETALEIYKFNSTSGEWEIVRTKAYCTAYGNNTTANYLWVNVTELCTFTLVGGDTTAPIISAVANSTPTTSSVTITWTTDEASDSLVKYGNVSGSGNYTLNVSNATKVTSHSIALSGLDSNMAYYFVVNSTDASGNSNESSEYNFTTATEDVTAPVISDVANSTPTSSSVTITWTTDEASDSVVKYGNASGSYTANVSNTTKVTLHSIALSGLDSNMAYYFVVNSTDASGNSNESSEYNFTTVETTVNISITLIGGWNLIAIPVYPLNATVASVFADVNMFGKSVYKYGSGGYEVVTTVEPKVGYWVFSVGSPTIWIEGTPVTS